MQNRFVYFVVKKIIEFKTRIPKKVNEEDFPRQHEVAFQTANWKR
jgi:hypothetical protein